MGPTLARLFVPAQGNVPQLGKDEPKAECVFVGGGRLEGYGGQPQGTSAAGGAQPWRGADPMAGHPRAKSEQR